MTPRLAHSASGTAMIRARHQLHMVEEGALRKRRLFAALQTLAHRRLRSNHQADQFAYFEQAGIPPRIPRSADHAGSSGRIG